MHTLMYGEIMTHEIIIVGSGIIGINIALALQDSGFREVILLDRAPNCVKVSDMNAGAFAFTDIVPLATPGIMRKAPKWLLDPMGPLSIPPSYAFKIAPWMLRFWRASWRDRYQASIQAQVNLMDLSRVALERQIKKVSSEHLIQRDGQLQLYEGAGQFDASLPGWNLRREHGIRFDFLKNSGAIAEVQPGIDPRFTHAGFTPDWMNACDPAQWLEHLTREFCQRGGRIVQGNVASLNTTEDGVILNIQSGDKLFCKQLVVAAGAWSHILAKTLGDHIPLETERGYNTTLPEGAFELRTHLTFGNHGFVVSRNGNGIRVGGATELGGLNLSPNFKRAEHLLNKAAKFLPCLETSGGQQQMGFRPSTPDSLPIIDISPKTSRVIYAFGHGHLGLTQAAGTAELITELLSGRDPKITMAPYSASRF
jgi:D-amino-acid dehydrogenase